MSKMFCELHLPQFPNRCWPQTWRPNISKNGTSNGTSIYFNGSEVAANGLISYRPCWVCLKIGYIPNYSHLIGIMISKTIGFRGLAYFQTHPVGRGLISVRHIAMPESHITALEARALCTSCDVKKRRRDRD